MNDNPESQQSDADRARLDAAVQTLIEHFDSVQIFATRSMPAEFDGTVFVDRGAGNWHARYGQIRDWMTYQEEQTRIRARKDAGEE